MTNTQDFSLNERLPTGVEGLDEILLGGLPGKCMYLIQGDPGSGKTTLALQFLLEGLRQGEKGYYITLSETKEELMRVAHSHGWSLDEVPMLELSSIERILRPEAQNTVFHPSEVDLKEVTNMLLAEMDRSKPGRIVFDSLSEFRLLAETPLRYRRQLLAMKQEFARHRCTVLLLDDKMDKDQNADPHILSLSHGVVEMEQHSPDCGTSRRRLRVMKMRGSRFSSGWHDYNILKGGLKVYPRLVASDYHASFSEEPVSTGIQQFDQVLGGGLDPGTTTLIMGAAGTGKSSLALQCALHLGKTDRGRAVLYAFDETVGVMLRRTRSLSLDLDEQIAKGKMRVEQVDPAELSPGEFAVRVRKAVESGVKLVIIDSLNGYLNAMPGERYLVSQLHELAGYLNQQGVFTLIVMAQHGLVSVVETPVDISYLADTVVLLRFFEVEGAVKKALAVVKKRSGGHEQFIREIRLDATHGIQLGEPLKQFHGVLGGVPVFHGNIKHMLSA